MPRVGVVVSLFKCHTGPVIREGGQVETRERIGREKMRLWFLPIRELGANWAPNLTRTRLVISHTFTHSVSAQSCSINSIASLSCLFSRPTRSGGAAGIWIHQDPILPPNVPMKIITNIVPPHQPKTLHLHKFSIRYVL